QVRVHERHGGALGKLLSRNLVEILACELPVLLGHLAGSFLLRSARLGLAGRTFGLAGLHAVPPAHVYVGDHVHVSLQVNGVAARTDTPMDEPPQVHTFVFHASVSPKTAWSPGCTGSPRGS